MKRSIVLSVALIIVTLLVISCKKDDNNNQTQPKTLEFSSLTASDTSINVADFTTITAVADGDEIFYTWGSESGYGSIVGSGAVIQWSVCHADIFVVYCQVEDKYGEKIRKNITIRVKP